MTYSSTSLGYSRVGKRVKFNEDGLRRIKRQTPERGGTIVGEAYDRTCWRVLWDGNKVPEAVHKSFISIISD